MELLVVSLIGLVVVVAMIALVMVQVNARNKYWEVRKAQSDAMRENDRAWLEAHGVRVEHMSTKSHR